MIALIRNQCTTLARIVLLSSTLLPISANRLAAEENLKDEDKPVDRTAIEKLLADHEQLTKDGGVQAWFTDKGNLRLRVGKQTLEVGEEQSTDAKNSIRSARQRFNALRNRPTSKDRTRRATAKLGDWFEKNGKRASRTGKTRSMNSLLTDLEKGKLGRGLKALTDSRQIRSAEHLKNGRFTEAAAEVFDALVIGKPWDKEELFEQFGGREKYFSYFDNLEKATKNQPTAASLFLLAYHESMLGEREKAADAFRQANKLAGDTFGELVSHRLGIETISEDQE